MNRIFISYSRQDAAAADQIAGTLERAGCSVFIEKNRLRGGSAFHEPPDREIARCDVFVVLLSSASLESLHVHRELQVAVDGYERPVLPVVVDEVDPAAFRLPLAGLQRVDFRAGSDQQLADIIAGIHRAAAQDRQRHPPPSKASVIFQGAGRALHALGFMLGIGGMGYFIFLFTRYWNAPLGAGPPPAFRIAFGVFFAGVVLVLVGRALRQAGRSRSWW